MTGTLERKPTQVNRVLAILEKAQGGWVNGGAIMRKTWITQLAARICELKDEGYDIETSDFRDKHRFVSYRLIPKETLF